MPEQAITPAIREEASRLFGERAAGLMTGEDEARLAEWLAADLRHARAFATVETLWHAIDGATMPAPVPVPTETVRAARSPRRRWNWRRREGSSRRRWAQGALAASVALLAIGHFGDVAMRMRADALTGTGERQTIALADGSAVLLNTDSAIAIDYGRERRVRLLRGEAAFTVAPDRTRPFVVEAAGGTVQALGTRFVVRLEDDDARVAVTEHSVEIALPAAGSRIVREGEALAYGPGGIAAPHAITHADADAWTRGVIRVVDRPLGEVVREIGRYHSGYIRVADDNLAARPVNGVFRIDRPVGAIDAIEHTLGIRSTRLGDMVIILHD